MMTLPSLSLRTTLVQISLLVLLFGGYNVRADDNNLGFEAINQAAKLGDADAQFALSRVYARGEGIERDSAKAAHWSRLAAKQGHVDAQFSLGIEYATGGVGEYDFAEAHHWFRLAAEQGHVDAQWYLGGYFSLGIGGEKNLAEAAHWYLLAAKQGHVDAQHDLGTMYFSGTGVEKNNTEAIRWYRLAAEQGHATAQTDLGHMYYFGDEIEQNNTEAIRWYRLAAEQGHAAAQTALSYMYYFGHGIEQNYDEAIRWLRLAAKQGYSSAESTLKEFMELVDTRFKVFKWNEGTRLSSLTIDHEKSISYFVNISYSKGEEKRMYFNAQEVGIEGKEDLCDNPSTDPDDQVWEFNGQAVSMNVFCEVGNKGRPELSATPRTKKGEAFVIGLFKRSVNDIKVKAYGFEFPVSAVGFTAEWNKLSAEVL